MFTTMAMGDPRDNTACRFVMTPHRRRRLDMPKLVEERVLESMRRCQASAARTTLPRLAAPVALRL
jgi:hypothetical protein